MKKRALIIGLCVIGLILGVGDSVLAITLNIASIENASLHFVGGTNPYFEFINDSSGNTFQITNVQDGAGDSQGLYGSISSTYAIGTVTHIGSIYSADVTGTGTLTIKDGSTPFTATVEWQSIYTFGGTGGLNTDGNVNLSNIYYSGTKSDLLSFIAEQTATVSFNFVPPQTLSQLTASGADNRTSYAGVLSAVPLPSTLLLLGSGLVGLVGLRYRRKLKG